MAASGKKSRERWKMLKRVLIDKKSNVDGYNLVPPNFASVRRFSTFNLFTVVDSTVECSPAPSLDGKSSVEGVNWSTYIYKDSTSGLISKVEIALLPNTFSLEDLQGFNNTGNVCVWPSEEVMAYYCLENWEIFKGKSVCELGAGMSGLSGVFIANMCQPKEVFITDGNGKSVDNLQHIIHCNQLSEKGSVTAEVVIWQDSNALNNVYKHLKDRFDVVICADCLFFSEVHNELIALLLHLIKPNGTILIFAPERNGTLKIFTDLAQEHFDVQVSESYMDIVSKKHAEFLHALPGIYDASIHYPLMITMKRIMQ